MQRSLSAKLSFLIVLVTALLFLGLTVFLSRVSRESIRAEAEKDAVQILDNTELRVNDILDDVAGAADMLAWFVQRDIKNPDRMPVYAMETVRQIRVITSCSISFEPYFYKNKGEYYSILGWRRPDGTISWEQEGEDDYRYFDMEWYTLPKEVRKTCWTKPYEDDLDSTDIDKKKMLVSYSKPIYKPDSTYAGSVSLDLSLRQLSEKLYDVKPYPHAYAILLDCDGIYMVHPDTTKLLYQSIFTSSHAEVEPRILELGESMCRHEEGTMEVMLDGERNYIFYCPVEKTGWSLAIVCPEKDIFSAYFRMKRDMILILVAGLLVMFFLFIWLIRKMMNPLGNLAEEADYIASGNFDHEMQPTRRTDEIGVLSHSFENMQSSLVRHIKQLTETTASRERLERELQIARNIQMGMVPHDYEITDNLDLYALMCPAREVGGDLYDFFCQDDQFYFCIGDVSGKGIPASLFMAVSRGMFRIVAREGVKPAEIARRINDTVAEKNEQMLFVTMFIGCLDLKTGALEYCNCGHNAPVLLSGPGSKPVFLDCKPNTAIGILPGFAYEGQRIDDLHGQVLFLYTDGLNEAENEAHDQFGNERMLEELGGAPFIDAKDMVGRLHKAVEIHVDGAEASDDLTMLCLMLSKQSS